MKTVTTLTENVEKEDLKWPDWLGRLVLDRISFEVAGWLNRTKNNDPFVSLSLSLKGERDAEKIPVTLWQKKNRQASADPHFRGKETIAGKPYRFSGWLGVSDGLRELRIEAEEVNPDELTDVARESRAKIDEVIREVDVIAVEPKPPPQEPPASARRMSSPADRDLEAEPDEIPF
jgi:hypothetical protein